jgi:hypothetical protein
MHLLTLWNEYKEKQTNPYGYTQFTHHFNQWANKQEASGKLNHKAGEKIFIDYTGKKLHFINRDTGEVKPAEVFVGILRAVNTPMWKHPQVSNGTI